MDRLLELVRLHRMGHGKRHIAAMLGMSPNTERDYRLALDAAGLLAGPANALHGALAWQRPPAPLPPQQSRIERWSEVVESLRTSGARPRTIFDRLRWETPPYKGNYAQIKRLCRALRRAQGPRPQEVSIPVESGHLRAFTLSNWTSTRTHDFQSAVAKTKSSQTLGTVSTSR